MTTDGPAISDHEHHEVVQAMQELKRLQVRSDSLEAANRILSRDNLALAQDLGRAQAEATALRRKVSAMRSSTSWKVSRPVRALGRLRRGRSQNARSALPPGRGGQG